jgi:hypothetical protein
MKMTLEEKNRLRCISEGVRRGLAPVPTEPLPNRIEELVRALRLKFSSAATREVADSRCER